MDVFDMPSGGLYYCTTCRRYVEDGHNCMREAMRPKEEAVNHPNHYGGDTKYEVIKVIEAWKLDFHLGNAVKYIARAGKKDPSKTKEDIDKAIWYLERKRNEL